MVDRPTERRVDQVVPIAIGPDLGLRIYTHNTNKYSVYQAKVHADWNQHASAEKSWASGEENWKKDDAPTSTVVIDFEWKGNREKWK